MGKIKMPSKEYLDECLDYNKDTGVFTWKKRPVSHFVSDHGYAVWNARYAGKIAGRTSETRAGKIYNQISINKKLIYSHRIAWLISYGYIDDSMQIDHIDGNGGNNSLVNLRLVTENENAKNKSIPSNNTSGCVGVSFLNREQKWRSRINFNGKEITLGLFINKDDAVKARKDAEKRYGYHENHGNRVGNNG